MDLRVIGLCEIALPEAFLHHDVHGRNGGRLATQQGGRKKADGDARAGAGVTPGNLLQGDGGHNLSVVATVQKGQAP
eukprot:Skav232131  [mRNA]  locus=scaffold1744:100982:103338:+ [translate_table: standard]